MDSWIKLEECLMQKYPKVSNLRSSVISFGNSSKSVTQPLFYIYLIGEDEDEDSAEDEQDLDVNDIFERYIF